MARVVLSKQLKMGIDESLRKITILQLKIAREERVLQECMQALKAHELNIQDLSAARKGCA